MTTTKQRSHKLNDYIVVTHEAPLTVTWSGSKSGKTGGCSDGLSNRPGRLKPKARAGTEAHNLHTLDF